VWRLEAFNSPRQIFNYSGGGNFDSDPLFSLKMATIDFKFQVRKKGMVSGLFAKSGLTLELIARDYTNLAGRVKNFQSSWYMKSNNICYLFEG